MYAAQQGDVESARRLLDAGAAIDDTAADGTTSLVLAAFAGRGSLAAFLLDRGANPDAAEGGYTALHVAVLRNDVGLVTVLLARNAKVNARLARATFFRFGASDYAFNRRWLGATPFWLAAAFHDVPMMQVLSAGGADTRMPIDDGTTPLMAAIGPKKNIDWRPEVRRTFSETGNPFPPGPEEERMALETVKALLGMSSVDLDAQSGEGDTALHRACAKRYVSVAKFLAEKGARLDLKNRNGLSPLGVARADLARPGGASDAEAFRRVFADIDASREQLVAVLRGFGARE